MVTIFILAKEKIFNWPKSGPVETGPTGPVATPLVKLRHSRSSHQHNTDARDTMQVHRRDVVWDIATCCQLRRHTRWNITQIDYRATATTAAAAAGLCRSCYKLQRVSMKLRNHYISVYIGLPSFLLHRRPTRSTFFVPSLTNHWFFEVSVPVVMSSWWMSLQPLKRSETTSRTSLMT